VAYKLSTSLLFLVHHFNMISSTRSEHIHHGLHLLPLHQDPVIQKLINQKLYSREK